MSTHRGYVLIAILVTAAVTGIIPAFAANELACPDCINEEVSTTEDLNLFPIVVETDKAVYDHQSTIVVSGHVRDPNTDMQVSVKVIGPTGNVVTTDQLQPDENGDFEVTLNTSSPLWMQNGVYTINAQYGAESRQYQDKIQIVGEEIGQESCDPSEITAKIGGDRYCIPYSITGATIITANLETKSKSLNIKIMADSDGEITLEIPRSVLDSKDDSFFVLVDGEETSFEEEKTSTTRSLTIQFYSGAEEIEIIGTQIVPEFGTIAALVLAVAIISIIAVSAKTRLRLLPKY